MTFSLDDFGSEVERRPGGCCPKCYDCATHFRYFCEALEHVGRTERMHKVEVHKGKPEVVHSCGCELCRKWIDVN